jgi:hypothetical protein
MNNKIPIVATLILILATLILIDAQYTNIGFLQLHSIDEYALHGSLRSMYVGVLDLKISKLFSYGFYQYGFVYFLINLLVSFPALLLKYTSLAIFLPRFIASLFAVGSLAVAYKFTRYYLGNIASVFFVFFIVTMPAFWFNATWFHPDWAMTFFLLGSTFFLQKDGWQFGRKFYIAILSFSLAVAFKYQAVTALPLIFMYVFYDNIRNITTVGLKLAMKRLSLSFGVILGIFLLLNPFIAHPVGWKLFMSSLMSNLHSNAVNHGIASIPTLWDKIHGAVGDYYVGLFLFIALLVVAIFSFKPIFKDKERSIFPVVSVNFFINLAYLLFFVNKSWQIYYLPVMVLGSLLILYPLMRISLRRQIVLFIGVIAIQLICYTTSYVDILTVSRDTKAPDMNDYSLERNSLLNNFIVDSLKGKVTKNDWVLITPYTPFDYEKLGLTFDQVRIIYGPLDLTLLNRDAYIDAQQKFWGDSKSRDELAASYKEKRFIVLRKNIPFINTKKIENSSDKEGYNTAVLIMKDLDSGKLGYRKIAENDSVLIYELIK